MVKAELKPPVCFTEKDPMRNGFSFQKVVGFALLGGAFCLSGALPVQAVPQTPKKAVASTGAPPTLPPGTVSPVPTTPPVILPLRILFAGSPLPTIAGAEPYRDPADNVLCIAPEALEPLGITYIVDEKMGKVSLLGPDGTTNITVGLRTPPTNITGSKGAFVPVVEVIEGLNGKCEWETAENTLYVRAKLLDAEMLGGQLRIRATLPVSPKVSIDKGGRLIILDFAGAEIGTLPRQMPLVAPNLIAARSGQFQEDVARIVLEMSQPSGYAVFGGKPSTQIVLNPSGAPAGTTPQPPVFITNKPQPTTPKVAVNTPVGKASLPAPSVVKGVSVKRVSDSQVQVVVSANRAPGVQTALDRNRLTLNLLNATLSAGAVSSLPAGSADRPATHPLLKALQLIAKPSGSGAAQLVIELARAVNFTVRPLANGSLIVDLKLPSGAGGRLSGKLIAVDAGHGNDDSGAVGVNGSREKNVNLAIALKVAEGLREAGANVLLTRAGDTYIPVNERPKIANRAGADFFLSVHSDSAGRNRSISGSTVYYHADWASCRTLAQCIADRFQEMGGIRSKGVRTDYIRFPGDGYGVLRNARMVAVLIECGYMTNSSDVSKLNDTAWQQRIAKSIVSGLRDYIEGNPDFDTRNINPKAVGALPPVEAPAPVAEMPIVPEIIPTEVTTAEGDETSPSR